MIASLAELRPLADSSVGRGRLELVPLDKFPPHHVMDYASDSEYFQKCRYIHEVELVNMKLQMRILETHLETKDRLIRNLEDIIDEQETRISHMEDFIQGVQGRRNSRSRPGFCAGNPESQLKLHVIGSSAFNSAQFTVWNLNHSDVANSVSAGPQR
ncbi:hypothetical protein Y032_0582g284 [Ancylostoma ceylanicum]|uniref:Uncharacterized protein n=1 Tax=Ancylostoma ceylanicum TaxID=53326 RepID=A0A016WND6_9BILA|nr:hypothetical protein Y032_0582g284 [Ancylostoma ceylanicum]